MGQVYQATDTKLNRQVALKILPEAFASDPDRLVRCPVYKGFSSGSQNRKPGHWVSGRRTKMSDRLLAPLGVLTIAFAVVSLVPQSAAGQDRVAGPGVQSTAATSTWTAPRTPDGQPDLQGV